MRCVCAPPAQPRRRRGASGSGCLPACMLKRLVLPFSSVWHGDLLQQQRKKYRKKDMRAFVLPFTCYFFAFSVSCCRGLLPAAVLPYPIIAHVNSERKCICTHVLYSIKPASPCPCTHPHAALTSPHPPASTTFNRSITHQQPLLLGSVSRRARPPPKSPPAGRSSATGARAAPAAHPRWSRRCSR